MSKAKVPIAVMIGAGSKLPAILRVAAKEKSKFYISLVVSHKAFSKGVELAIKKNIPAIYFKLPDYRQRIFKGETSARSSFMKHLGWFISQREYSPKLLIFAGWDLVMDKNFFDFFKCDFGNGYAAINLHPALMPLDSENQKIKLPDGSTTKIIKGEQEEVLRAVIKNDLTYFGPSVHFMVPTEYDTGTVVKRAFIKVDKNDTIESLRKKLMPVEDRILVSAIEEVISKLYQPPINGADISEERHRHD